jgi:hypothetical protein
MTVTRMSLRESHECCEFTFTNYVVFITNMLRRRLLASYAIRDLWPTFLHTEKNNESFDRRAVHVTVCAAFERLKQLTIFTKLTISIRPYTTEGRSQRRMFYFPVAVAGRRTCTI